ncbi:MAG TPA: glycerol-3-phosphate 1-O-acyltransferase PlsY [Gemmatimonadales bacterium]|nr:glycerol-3-phosphate 1-O-acyltransferase PlsY [Gemmatimonadales bacterium]
MSGQLVLWVIASYLVGAIPTSYLTVRLLKGQDLRTLGSGNLGATNLYRVLGWKYAVPVGIFDLLKGAVPVLYFAPLAGGGDRTAILLGMAAVVGHVFSVFAGFKGGKGVATGAGVVLGLAPWAFVAALLTWIVLVKVSGYVSLASLGAALMLPPAVYLLHPERRPMIWLFAGLAGAIVLFHRANIRRLLAGTENRFGRRAA